MTSRPAEDYPEYWITLTVTPVLLILGLVGNILSILVMRRKKFRNNTTSVFIIALAFADSAYLLTNFLTITCIRNVTGIALRETSSFSCKLIMYIVYVSKAFGAWIILSVSLERLVLVKIPLHAKSIFTVKRTKMWISFLLLWITAIYIYVPILVDIHSDGIQQKCDFSHAVERLNTILNIFDCIFYSLFPSFVLILSNLILYCILKAQKQNMSKINDGSDSLRFTLTLIIVSISYLTLTLPIATYLVFHPIQVRGLDHTLYIVLYTLNISNNAINFILYCLSGPIFRLEMKRMFRNKFCCNNVNTVGILSQNSFPQNSSNI